MKKLKKLLPAFIAALIAIVLVFSVACSGSCSGEPEPDPDNTTKVTETLDSIAVNTDNAKTEFYMNETFTYEGLKVTAHISKSDGTSEDRDVSSQAVIDSSAFDSSTQGSYDIKVSYTLGGSTTKTTTYTVTVNYKIYGVNVILIDGAAEGIVLDDETAANNVKGSVDLTSEKTSITIDPTKIEVRKPDTKGNIDYTEKALDPSEYTVSVYKNEAKIETLSGITEGAYQIWAKLNEQMDGHDVEGFARLFVNNNLQPALTINSGAVLSQNSGANTITDTWEFTATYATGTTKDVTESVTFDPAIDTRTTGEKTTKATYVETNASGVEYKATVEVSYQINASGSTSQKVTNTLNIASLVEKNPDTTHASRFSITAEMLTSSGNGFLSLTEDAGTKAEIRDDMGNDPMEIVGSALSVTFASAGSIAIEFASTGTSNTSGLALIGPDGEYVTDSEATPSSCTKLAADVTLTDATGATQTNKAGLYTAKGSNWSSNYCKVTYYITTPGTYKIFGFYYYQDNDTPNTEIKSRGTRIKSIVMEEGDSGDDTGVTYTFDRNALVQQNPNGKTVTDGKDPRFDVTDELLAASGNSFLKRTPGTESGTFEGKVELRDDQGEDPLEVTDGALQVTFTKGGYITLEVCSTSGTNTSGVALIGPDGKYVTNAEADASNPTAGQFTKLETDDDVTVGEETQTNKAGLWTVYGKNVCKVTFYITTPGTYTIYGKYYYEGVKSGEVKTSVLSRCVRIMSIEMRDGE